MTEEQLQNLSRSVTFENSYEVDYMGGIPVCAIKVKTQIMTAQEVRKMTGHSDFFAIAEEKGRIIFMFTYTEGSGNI